jgi:hypothetical protein
LKMSGTCWTLQHQASYRIGKPSLNLQAKASIVSSKGKKGNPRLLISPSAIPSGILMRLGRMNQRLAVDRIREMQVIGSKAEQVVVLAHV